MHHDVEYKIRAALQIKSSKRKEFILQGWTDNNNQQKMELRRETDQLYRNVECPQRLEYD
jgi:hypothetical protein